MYKPLQKKSSSWTPTSIQKKSKNFSKPGSSAVQRKRETQSDFQDLPSHSAAAADLLTANIMRSLDTEPENEQSGEISNQEVNNTAPRVTSVSAPLSNSPQIQRQEEEGEPNENLLPAPVLGRAGAQGAENFLWNSERHFQQAGLQQLLGVELNRTNHTNIPSRKYKAQPGPGARQGAPRANNGNVSYHLPGMQDPLAQNINQQMQNLDYNDIRFNQAQVNAQGNMVGRNRPDNAGINPNTDRRWNLEVDTQSGQSLHHEQHIPIRDPDAVNSFVRVDPNSGDFSSARTYQPKPQWMGKAGTGALAAGGMAAVQNLMDGELSAEDVGSIGLNAGFGGLSGYTDDLLTPRLGGGVGGGLKAGAIIDAATSGLFSTWDNAGAYEQGDIGAGQATANVAVDTGVGVGSGLAGAAAGAAIGSVIPVAGTAVGAGVGFLAGMAGSYLTHELANRSGFTDWAKEGLGGALGNYDENLAGVWDGIAGARNSISEGVGNTWNGIQEGAGNLWNNASETAGNTWNGIQEGAGNLWNNASETAGNTWNGIQEGAGNAWDNASETAGNAWSGIKEGAGNVWDNASETAGNAWSGIQEGAGNAWDNASETAGNAWDAVTSWW
ncbi:phage tail protein [Coleofasciculus sp. F4-SAH-05]|uniref:phage tail protein n=1 Tax=Coleofasciculus sp. F4-SAH-05 TaxID=3069525 RepID=UPI003303F3AF